MQMQYHTLKLDYSCTPNTRTQYSLEFFGEEKFETSSRVILGLYNFSTKLSILNIDISWILLSAVKVFFSGFNVSFRLFQKFLKNVLFTERLLIEKFKATFWSSDIIARLKIRSNSETILFSLQFWNIWKGPLLDKRWIFIIYT